MNPTWHKYPIELLVNFSIDALCFKCHTRKFLYLDDLVVRDPIQNDVGVYECHAISTAGVHIDAAKVFVAEDGRVPVAPLVKLKQSTSPLGRRDNVFLECIILAGIPTPQIKWFKGVRELLQSSNERMVLNGTHLKINDARETDTGSYSCVVDNIAGSEISAAKIVVGSVPTIISSPETVRVNVEEEVNDYVQVTLQCTAVGQPSPRIAWQRNGIPLDLLNYSRYTVLSSGHLFITNAQLEDQASFTCIAENDYGAQSKTTLVVISGLASPVLGHAPPEQQLIEGEDLRLSCVVVLGSPRPEIKWFRDGSPIKPSPSLSVGYSISVDGG
ncbi:immunoglobulin I-set domain protein [Cooperia oncophora]